MLELNLRFLIADDTSTDEALIASLPHDLRAIADRVAQAWPGNALDPSLGSRGELARPAQLELELAHGGRARLEVRQRSAAAPLDRVREPGRSTSRPAATPRSIEPLLEDLTAPDRWADLQDDPAFTDAIAQLDIRLASQGQTDTHKAQRLVRAFTGTFRGLDVKNRAGQWRPADETPSVDPFYACAVFDCDGQRQRVPLPQILPDAAGSRRSYSSPPETMQLMALLERTVPEQVEDVRAAGRALLERRRLWMGQGRYGK